MKLLILVTSVVVVCSTASDEESWKLFKEKYNKSYGSLVEDKVRFTVFQNNLRKIEQHNKKYEETNVSYTLGINKFADLSQEEFVNRLRNTEVYGKREEITLSARLDAEVPEKIDWRGSDAISPVKDQGNCSGSFYFAALGVLESYNYILNKVMVDLSEQSLVDCSLGYNNGCNGGGVLNSLAFVRDRGVDYEQNYPYQGALGDCKLDSNRTVFKTIGFVMLPISEELVKENVGTVGPVAVTFDGTNLGLYSGGIYNDPSCTSDSTGRQAGVIVGYDTSSDGTDYWIVKISFGGDWGEDGYVRIARNAGNKCGIVNDAIYPTL